MSPERWQQIKALFESAMDVEPERRSKYVSDFCGNDAELRREVESLLESERVPGMIRDDSGLLAARALQDAFQDHDPMIGRNVGAYRIERLLGKGGMGAVYLASGNNAADQQAVAVKVIKRGFDTAGVIRRFRRERQILSNLDHKYIARILEGGACDDGQPYFVMEYIEGRSIDHYVEDRELPVADRLRLFMKVCAAVDAAHRNGIVHRDIKPGNILVSPTGEPKLLDFGIAKILNPDDLEGEFTPTFTGSARAMTPDYASPEQVRGEQVTPATDIYSLGIVLYELLTGRRPYKVPTTSPEEMSRVVCHSEPAKPSTHRPLAAALDDITLKALRKEPHARYATAAHFSADIEAYLENRRVAASRGVWLYRSRRYWTRNKRGITAFALSVIVLAAAVAFGMRWARRSPAADQSANELNPGSSAGTFKPRPSVAVLGFRNLSNHRDADWLSTALSEMFTTELAAGGQLRTVRVENVSRVKLDLAVGQDEVLSNAGAAQFQKKLGAEYFVDGTFLILDRNDQLRVDLRISNLRQEVLLAVSETGATSDLFAIVSKAGSRLREQLGVAQTGPGQVRIARAAFPQSPAAIRFYTEGLEKLRVFDAIAALPLLQKAAEIDPSRPLTHSAIAEAWSMLGYDGKAAEAAMKAFELIDNLGRGEPASEERLVIEGRYRETQQDWEKAIGVYKTLWISFADDVEYALRLCAAQVAAGKGKDALETVAAMRQLRPPVSDDPRIDIAEGDALGVISDYKRQQQVYAEAVKKSRASGARLLLARARVAEGRAFYSLGQPATAIQAYEEGQSLFAAAGDRAGVASALSNLAVVYLDQKDRTNSITMFEQALATAREIGDKRQMGTVLTNLGIIRKDQERFAEALSLQEQALALRREIGNKPGASAALSNIGVILFEQDRFSEAGERYEQALQLSREIGDRRGIVRALHNLSIVKKEMGDLAGARKGYEESLSIREAIGDRRGRIVALIELSEVLFEQGQIALSRQKINEGLALAREQKFRPAESQFLYFLGDIALAEGDSAAARKHQEAARAIREEMHEDRMIIESDLALANIAIDEGRVADALALISQVKNNLHGSGAKATEAEAELFASRALLRGNRIDEAAQALARAQALSASTQRIYLRAMVAMTASRIKIAEKQSNAALQDLNSLLPSLQRNGAVRLEFEIRLAQCEVMLKSDKRSEAQMCSASLGRDSLAKGFKAVAQKAAELAR